MKTKVAVIGGAGHIGLPLSLALSLKGFDVLIVDRNKIALNKIKKLITPFEEINLKENLKKVISNKKYLLNFSNTISSISNCDQIIVCIGTPIDKKLKPDTRAMLKLISGMKKYLNKKKNIIIRSSISPGTYKIIEKKLKNFCISYCPERIAQGYSFLEMPKIPQIISSRKKLGLLKSKIIFSKISKKMIFCSPEEAELAKLFSNAFRYIYFSISNEFYKISTSQNLNFLKIRNIMQDSYPRNKNFPKPGFVGGPCLMKDTMQLNFLKKSKDSLLYKSYLVNNNLPAFVFKHVINKYKFKKNSKILFLGLTFKPNNDDLRGSLTFDLYKKIKKKFSNTNYFDPYLEKTKNYNIRNLLKQYDFVILGTAHKVFGQYVKNNKKIINPFGDFLKA